MAITGPTIWEVRTTGNAANGGGYDAALGGVDYSQQNSAQVAYTDLVIDATTATKCTSAGNPFTSSHVGNIINITGGTGFTVQRVQVVSVAAGVATCDKSLGTLSSTGGTGNLGGALASFDNADAVYAPGNVVYIQSGSYTSTTARTLTCDGTLAGGNISFVGYPSGGSRTDQDVAESSMPVLTSATNSIAIITVNNGNFLRFRNLKATHTAGTRGIGFTNTTAATSNGAIVQNCVFDGCLWGIDVGNTGGASSNHGLVAINCTARNGTAGGFRNYSLSAAYWYACYAYSNAGPGFAMAASASSGFVSVFGCVSAGNTGASGHGFYSSGTTIATTSSSTHIVGCVSYNNAQSGIRFDYTTGRTSTHVICSNILVSNAAYGVSCATAGILDGNQAVIQTNAYYNNTSGARQNFATGVGDVTLSGNPFNNAGSNDFSLDNTASEGAACRGVAYPTVVGALGATAGTNYMDIGALQAQPSAGGGTVAYAFAG